jgi:energy-coupling factor transporter transmembrane protein EcfT
MFLTRLRHSTVIQRLDIRTKILGLLAIIVLTLLFEDPFYNLGILLLVGGITLAVNYPCKKISSLFSSLLPLFCFIMLFTGLAYAPDRFQLTVNRIILGYILPGQRLAVTLGGILLSLSFFYES